jgi:hypothetical protein
MKKLLPLFCLLGLAAQPAYAANINNLQAVGQADFRAMSEDLGSALSYKPLTPAEPLGVTGFDLGIEVTSTKMTKSEQAWKTATNSTSSLSSLYVPKLHIAKGLPFNIDVGAFYAAIPTTNVKLTGFELRYAPIPGGVATPAVAIRGSYTKMSGVDQLDFNTKGLDVSISKGFAMFTPYAGVGQVWVNSAATINSGRVTESFTQSKVFAGININLGLTNIALEGDKTGGTSSYGMKLGFRW